MVDCKPQEKALNCNIINAAWGSARTHLSQTFSAQIHPVRGLQLQLPNLQHEGVCRSGDIKFEAYSLLLTRHVQGGHIHLVPVAEPAVDGLAVYPVPGGPAVPHAGGSQQAGVNTLRGDLDTPVRTAK